MLGKKKKILILSVMFVLLAVTAYLNVALNNKSTEETGATVTTTSSFFATYREDRQSTRSEEISYYNAIIASESTSANAKTSAEMTRAELVKAMESELVMEGLIKAKGFEDCVVTTSLSNINVVVKSGSLEANEVAGIVQIVQEQTGKDIDNIKIIPIE